MEQLVLVCDNEEQINVAENEISANAGFGEPGQITVRWNNAVQRLDGKWMIKCPRLEWLVGISVPYKIEFADPALFS